MNHSLFKKIFRTIGIASIVAVSVMILFCSITLKQYFLKIKLEEIQQKVEDTISQYDIMASKLPDRLENILGNDVIIKGYDNSKQSICKIYPKREDGIIIDDIKIKQGLEPYINTVLGGNSIKGVTKIYGLKEDSIIVGEPIKQDGKIVGAIFVINLTKDFADLFVGFYVVLMISVVLVLTSTIIPIYLSSKKWFKPLDDMTNATMSMAKGDYSIRIEESQDDEIGDLARAFNELTLRLEQNDKEAKLLDQMRKDYVANISHELKTPVTSIRAVAEMLNDDAFSDKLDRKKYYSMILRESMRLEVLIKDMLELSNLQAGNVSVKKDKVDLNDILDEIYEKFEVIANDLDINLTIKKIENNKSIVFTNYNRIIQVLVILLDNAFKFTGEEGTVSLETIIEKEFVRVVVSDTGIGIDEEDRPFVFDRFYKVDKSRQSIGTGIGLSIAAEIIRHLDEEIYVESNVGVGSKFIFTIHYK